MKGRAFRGANYRQEDVREPETVILTCETDSLVLRSLLLS